MHTPFVWVDFLNTMFFKYLVYLHVNVLQLACDKAELERQSVYIYTFIFWGGNISIQSQGIPLNRCHFEIYSLYYKFLCCLT